MSLARIDPTPRSRVVAKLAGLALLLGAAAPANAQTPVHFGDIITQPGVYFLAGNQSGMGSEGIRIRSSDVTLLLLRFTLRGDPNYDGIVSLGNDNVAIYGGRVTNFQFGVLLTDARDCTVKDVRLDGCQTGLETIEMRDSLFQRLNCDHNRSNGVGVQGCEDCRYVSILAHDNARVGILIVEDLGFASSLGETPAGNKVRSCWAAYNEIDGIRVENQGAHEIVSNQCVRNGEAGIHLYARLPK